MDDRFFIYEVVIPSGTRTLEKDLADVVTPYVDHILSAGAMERLMAAVGARQSQLVSMNKRLRPVYLEMDLDGDALDFGYKYFHIGQVSVRFRLVKGEII